MLSGIKRVWVGLGGRSSRSEREAGWREGAWKVWVWSVGGLSVNEEMRCRG